MSRRRSRLYVAVVAGLLPAVIGRLTGMPVALAFLTAAMIGSLVYALFDPPRRYRRFGLSERDEAVDHSFGHIRHNYPEDPANK